VKPSGRSATIGPPLGTDFEAFELGLDPAEDLKHAQEPLVGARLRRLQHPDPGLEGGCWQTTSNPSQQGQ